LLYFSSDEPSSFLKKCCIIINSHLFHVFRNTIHAEIFLQISQVNNVAISFGTIMDLLHKLTKIDPWLLIANCNIYFALYYDIISNLIVLLSTKTVLFKIIAWKQMMHI